HRYQFVSIHCNSSLACAPSQIALVSCPECQCRCAAPLRRAPPTRIERSPRVRPRAQLGPPGPPESPDRAYPASSFAWSAWPFLHRHHTRPASSPPLTLPARLSLQRHVNNRHRVVAENIHHLHRHFHPLLVGLVIGAGQ